MARTIVIKLNRLASEPVLTTTDQGSQFVYYIVPAEVILNVDDIESPRRSGFGRYTGNIADLSTDCGVVTPPDGHDPVWTLASLPGAVASAEYSISLYYNEVGTADNGKTIVGIDYSGGIPSWLIPSVSVSDNKLSLRGTPPPGTASFTVTLKLIQSDNRTASKTFTVVVTTATPYLVARYNPADDKITVFSGPDAGETTLPLLTDTDTTGHASREQMRYFGANVANLETRYRYDSATGPAKGLHVFKLEHLGKTKYGSLTIANADTDYQVITLSDTPPVVTPPPAVSGAVIAMDARWIRTRAGDPWGENKVYVWFNVSNSDDLILFSKSQAFGFPYAQHTENMRITGDAKNYTHSSSVNSVAGDVVTFKFKAKGQADSAFQEISVNVPGGASQTTARTQIYPVVETNPPVTPGSGSASIAAQQIVSGGAGLLTPSVQWSSGKARIANLATPSVPSGSTLYYWISGQQPSTSLPTGYDFNPGDDVGVMVAIVPNNINPNDGINWTGKGWTNITIGPAPVAN
ncbi:hypothetical protein [Spirosoma pollinicola]|uniref:Uncharacterized protein n=1 Tax=Spirosoma pollinicola TaxID=2057025 RepID=A0A2K8YTM2_9BACT|nr:hypothetical protein [Spirosoma pollinicola]AUD00924.1 hypothetical protein CWM47_03300 [Spirosoma pollinicola]